MDVTETSGNTATATPADGKTSVTGGNTAKITVVVNNGTTSNTLYYAKFTTKAEADKAIAADFTEKLTLGNKSAGSTVSTSVTTVDGVVTDKTGDVTDIYSVEKDLALGKVVEEKTKTLANGTTATTTTNLGNYYVVRLVSTKAEKEVVSVSRVFYIEKSVNVATPVSGPDTTETTYTLR